MRAQPAQLFAKHAPVAQLDRASDYESEGRTFESFRARHFGTKLGTPKPPISGPGEIVARLLTVRHRVSLELVTAFPAGLGGAKNRVASPNV